MSRGEAAAGAADGDRSGDALVGAHDARAEGVDPLEERDAARLVVEEPPPPGDSGGSHSVYTFQPAGRSSSRQASMRSSSAGPRLGCTMVWPSTRPVPA